jgi:hypothetical protein
MFRILGFISGSAISIIGILLVLGVPKFNLSNFETDQARFDAALEKIREKRPAIEELVEELVEEEAAIVAEPIVESVAESAVETVAENSPDIVDVPADPPDIFDAELHWHEFWNPFRSEIAARGFVSQLEKVTGLDYRINKVETGVYQVGFAYTSDDERRSKISLISAATGLDLPAT